MDPRHFFKKIICDYDAKVKLNHPDILSYFASATDVVEYFRQYPKYFAIFEDDEGNPQLVGARLQEMRLCIGYSVRKRGYRCFDPDCPRLHLCRDFVGGYCNNGLNCDLCHSLNTDANMQVLRRLKLLDTYPSYPEDKLLALLRMSLPQICGLYNRELGCPNRNACTKLHLCKQNIIRVCENPICNKAHDLSSAHTQRLLKIYNLEGKTLEEIKDSLIVHKVMPKNDVEVNQIQIARHLDILRRKPNSRLVDAESAAAAELAINPEEIEQIQKAIGEVDLVDLLINQKVADSHAATLVKKREGLSKKENIEEVRAVRIEAAGGLLGRPKPVEAEKTYLCEAFVNGNCTQANCKDVHFPNRFLWQVQIRGQWYDMHSVNNNLEEAYNRRDRDYVTQVPLEAKYETGELIQVNFRPVIKGQILHSKENVNLRRLQIRPVTHLPTNLLMPDVISGKQEATKEKTAVQAEEATDKPESKEASKGRVCWQIHVEEEWIPLTDANDEIEQAYQRQDEEYITEIMINNDDGDDNDKMLKDQIYGHYDNILVAINLKRMIAISLSDPTEFQVRRQVNHEEANTNTGTKQQTETEQRHDCDAEINIEEDDASDVEAASESSDWQWEWRNKELEWVPYHKMISDVLEKQYTRGKPVCRMRVDGETWIVDYLAETQENQDTKELHHIRRVNK